MWRNWTSKTGEIGTTFKPLMLRLHMVNDTATLLRLC